ncbi:MAG: hypothetical protein WC665_04800 [Sulfurimonas sp.]|jgi:hypothetical protein
MKVIFTAVMTILISSSLGAYTKQIVFDSFKDKESANAAFEKLKSDESYSKLELISKENDFNVHVIGSCGQNLLVAEPIKNQFILEEALKLVVPKFLNATIKDIEKASQISSIDMSSASEYPKKIMLGAFSLKEGAYEELKRFQEDEAYEKFNSLATENDFVVHVRSLCNYNILVVEPIKNKEMYEEVMRLVAPKFEGVYSLKYSGTTQTKEEEQSLESPAVVPVKIKAADKNISAVKVDVNITEFLVNTDKKDTNTSVAQSDSNKSKADVNVTEIKADTNITASLVKETNTTNQATKSAVSAKKEDTIVVRKVKEEPEEESSFAMFVWLLILGVAAGAIIYAYPKAKRVFDQY